MSDAGGDDRDDRQRRTSPSTTRPSTALPDEGAITNGVLTARPTTHGTDNFPAPAPRVDTGDSALSVFDGTNAQGTWRLYVVDDAVRRRRRRSPAAGALDIKVKSAPYPSHDRRERSRHARCSTSTSRWTACLTRFPDDIDILLVGPAGQQATLMSDVGQLASRREHQPGPRRRGRRRSLPTRPRSSDRHVQADQRRDRDRHLFPARLRRRAGDRAVGASTAPTPTGRGACYVVDDAHVDQGTLSSWSLDIRPGPTPRRPGRSTINGGAALDDLPATCTLNLDAHRPGRRPTGVSRDAVQQRRRHLLGVPAVRRHGCVDADRRATGPRRSTRSSGTATATSRRWPATRSPSCRTRPGPTVDEARRRRRTPRASRSRPRSRSRRARR